MFCGNHDLFLFKLLRDALFHALVYVTKQDRDAFTIADELKKTQSRSKTCSLCHKT